MLLLGCTNPSGRTDPTNQGDASLTALADSMVVHIVPDSAGRDIAFQDEYDNYNFYRQGEVALAIPSVLQDLDGYHRTSFLIFQPYDSLRFALDTADNFWTLRAPNPRQEKELNFDVYYRREVSPITEKNHVHWSFQRFREYIGDLPLRERKIDSVYQRKLDYLAVYQKKNGLSQAFLSNWRRFIKYERLDALLFPTGYEGLDEKYLQEMSGVAGDFDDDASLANPYYRRSAWNCVRLLSHLAPKRRKTKLGVFAEQIDEHFTGLTRDYLMMTLLAYAQRETEFFSTNRSEYDSLQGAFLAKGPANTYRDFVARHEDLEKLVIDRDQVVTADGKAVKLKSVLVKGKIHYVDFWASWCAPCLAEMPASEKLKEKYAGKPVGFLYFSRDDNPVAWERAAKRLGLSARESYLMPAKRHSSLAAGLKISAIPRYVILDDQGKVLSRDAPRPSDPRTVELLDRLIANRAL